MNSLPIIQGKKLRVYLDSESIENLLDKNNTNAKKLLNWIDTYNQYILDSDSFPQEVWTNYTEFLRSPLDSKHDKLNKVKTYEFKLNEEYCHEFKKRYRSFTFSHEFTKLTCKHLLNNVKSNMQEQITSLMINFREFAIRETEEARISNNCIPDLGGCLSENTNLLITNNKHLIKNRIKLEESLINNSYFHEYSPLINYPLNIVNVLEANEIIDLFLKYRNLYFYGIEKFPLSVKFSSQEALVEAVGQREINFDESNWYLASFRTKIPYHNVKDRLSESFGNKFIFVLMCIDEMGKLYYQGVNENTQIRFLYSFNYFISLITGIFDNLALMTNKKYNITTEKEQISLNPNRRDFIDEIKDKDTNLYNNIHDHIDFLKLIYELRNKIIHSEMFDMGLLDYGKNKLNTLIITEELSSYFRCHPKKIDKTKRLEFWKAYIVDNTQDPEEYLIEPFHFSKEATKILIEFSNSYLKLLGNSNFIKEFMERWKDSHHKDYTLVNDFNEFNLGY